MNRMKLKDADDAPSSLLAERSKDLLVRWASLVKEPDAYKYPYLGHGSILNTIVLLEASALQAREDYVLAAAKHLEQGMALLDKLPLSSSLYRGISGIGWAVQNFSRPDLLPWREEVLGDLDNLLAEGLEVTNNLNIDIINGLAGIAVYAVARGLDQTSSRELWAVLDHKISDYFATWCTSAHEDRQPESVANNLGVAHGVPGLLSVAAVASSRGLLSGQTQALLKKGLDTLWNVALVENGKISYPCRHGETKTSRLAWCYGGLGIAATFKNGAAIDAANIQRLRLISESSLAQYEAGAHGIRDASLCHGYAGAALTFQYLAQSGILEDELASLLRTTSHDACSAALDSGIQRAGTSSTARGMVPSPSFLEGGAGVALALSAMFSERRPSWMDLLSYY